MTDANQVTTRPGPAVRKPRKRSGSTFLSLLILLLFYIGTYIGLTISSTWEAIQVADETYLCYHTNPHIRWVDLRPWGKPLDANLLGYVYYPLVRFDQTSARPNRLIPKQMMTDMNK